MDKKYFDLVVKDLSGDITDQEKKELSEWLPGNEKNYEELLNLWHKSLVNEPFIIDEDQAWDRLKTRITRSGQPKLYHFRKNVLQIAAILILILAAVITAYQYTEPEDDSKVIASNENVEIFYLPDSTQVWLNKNSTLTLEDFEGRERKVLLIGEAYFKVKRDPSRPFVILAGNTVTRVLGTEFDLKAYPDAGKVEINVESGQVLFTKANDNKAAVYLQKDEQGILDGTGNLKKIPKTYADDRWLSHRTRRAETNDILLEITNPKQYLFHEYAWRDNLVKQAVIEGKIDNGAIFTTYKNIRLKAIYYTGDNNKMGVDYYRLSKKVNPGDQIKYKFKLGNWFRRASKVEVEIEDAHAIE